ncbi:hypothetical protein LVJ94_09405 [Pendulispora rubella]|uniref:Uncharacterized protein n=1 Tax=Pendulispora rubella TaxID=2741070 RepID=A0ABZ2L935_9BACT
MSPTGKRNAKASDASDPVISIDPLGPSTPADRGEEDSLERHTTPGLGPLPIATAPSKTDVTDGTVSPPPSRQDDDPSLDDEVEASIASAPSTDDDREALRGLP